MPEKMLSHRILYFGRHQIYWDCMSEERYEIFHHGRLHEDRPTSTLTKAIPIFKDSFHHSSWWRQIVEDYSRCQLTVPTDKLPAIAGIVSAFQPPDDDIYLAGIWRGDLPRALIWHRADCRQAILSPLKVQDVCPRPYRAPSWSWASQDFPTNCVQAYGQAPSNEIWSVEIKQATVVFPGTNPFGHVTGGSLLVRGKLRMLSVARYNENAAHFSAFATPLDDSQSGGTAFYPDDLSPYMNIPEAETVRGTLGHNPSNEEIETASYPEVIALLLGEFGSSPTTKAAALAIEYVAEPNVYRRVGLLYFCNGRPAETIKEWFDGIEEQDLEII